MFAFLASKLCEELFDGDVARLDRSAQDCRHFTHLSLQEGVARIHNACNDLASLLIHDIDLLLQLGDVLLGLEPGALGCLGDLSIVRCQGFLRLLNQLCDRLGGGLGGLASRQRLLNRAQVGLVDGGEGRSGLLELLHGRLGLVNSFRDGLDDKHGSLAVLLLLLLPPLELLPLRVLTLALLHLLVQLVKLRPHDVDLWPDLGELQLCLRQGALLALPEVGGLGSDKGNSLGCSLEGVLDRPIKVLDEGCVSSEGGEEEGALVPVRRHPSGSAILEDSHLDTHEAHGLQRPGLTDCLHHVVQVDLV
mmetsp:Transcript_48021/g.108057  ORF Transcript_48021/g.108057 Transcript_48021/m.108057 type:complete len:306 (+) Transcript_48021:1371-2288(+)